MAILRAPEVKVDHYGTRTKEQWPETLKNYGIGDGAFYSKHIRCGDPLALWLFLKLMLKARAKQVTYLLKDRHWRSDPYTAHLLTGVRDASKFAIDHKFRLYRETDRAKMTVTSSNTVTATKRSNEAQS